MFDQVKWLVTTAHSLGLVDLANSIVELRVILETLLVAAGGVV